MIQPTGNRDDPKNVARAVALLKMVDIAETVVKHYRSDAPKDVMDERIAILSDTVSEFREWQRKFLADQND